MKRPLQLSLAIALALGVTDALALGLGAVQVKSGLNQPLIAEIPIIQSAPGESDGLIVGLASVEDFERVGMSRSSLGVPIEFKLGKNARGEPVIQVTSVEAVREPFLGILLEANWPKGRLLREYTILLDPPVMAPAVKGASAVAVATKATEQTSSQPLPASKPTAAKPPVASTVPAPTPTPPVAAPKPAPTPEKAQPAARTAGGNEYGPVAAGETLGEIARATLPGSDVNVNQMMLALLKNNPQAFFKENINALKRGAVLRIPSAEEIAASGSAREAAAAVRTQIDEWRGAASSAPTLVADTTPSTQVITSRSGSSSTSSERLALVPPREGKAGQGADDRPSGGRDGATGDVASKAELARVKEALTSKEQESGELKSRLKDLEDIKGKNEKLISLQSTELAELRDKLKQSQDQAAKDAKAATEAAKTAKDAVKAEPPAVVVATPEPKSIKAELPVAADAKVTKDDIWGNTSGADSGKPGTSPSDSTMNGGTTAAPGVDAGKDATATLPATMPEIAPTATAPVANPPVVAEKTPPPAPAKVEPKVDTKRPVAPTKSVASATPWYMEPMVLGAAAVGGLLLVILGIFGLRKRKPTVTRPGRQAIAGAFGDSPVGGAVSPDAEAEEQELIALVQEDPTNAGAHLELLSLYYAQGAAGKFEVAAEEMYAYVADPNEVSWREVRTMGEELVPHNPLFSNQDSIVDDFAEHAESEEYTFEEPRDTELEDFPDFQDETADAQAARSSFETASMPVLDVSDFDLGETHLPQPAASSDTSFSFDLPPIEEAPAMTEPVFEDSHAAPDTNEPGDELSDDEFFAGEDAIGTKLDLAKAYLDMGDPDGARSMLEEVLAEGSSLQQEEARKLISEIG